MIKTIREIHIYQKNKELWGPQPQQIYLQYNPYM